MGMVIAGLRRCVQGTSLMLSRSLLMLFTEDYEDIDIPSDWEDLITILNTQADIVIGDIYDIEEF